jgi:ACS family allantoate permease-like MFS transporter
MMPFVAAGHITEYRETALQPSTNASIRQKPYAEDSGSFDLLVLSDLSIMADEKKSVDTTASGDLVRTQHTRASSRSLKHAHDGDEALKALPQLGDGRDMIEMDEATNKYLLRKIDWALMPIMFIAFGLQYLDKATLTYASVMGLQHDLHLKGDNYQWLASIFYLGYLSFEVRSNRLHGYRPADALLKYPANRILQRFPIGKYCAVCIFIWGVVLACFAVTKNFAGAMAIRFMLGVMECAIVPGFTLIISQWYRKTEQGLRTCIWMSAPGLFTVIGGVLAYGIATATEKHPAKIEGWQILFLVCGVTTCTVGIVFLFVVPDNQLNARWLDQNDRILALSRIRGNQQGIGNKHFKWYQFREALTDPIVWGMVLYTLVWTITNGIYRVFSFPPISGLTTVYRRDIKLLYGDYQLLRLYEKAVSPLCNTWWRVDCHHNHRLRLPG